MKAMIELDLGSIFAGYTEEGEELSYELENVIKDAVIEGLISKFLPNIHKGLQEKIDKIVGDKVTALLDTKIEELLTNFLEKPVVISNGYKKVSYSSLIEYVEERMTEVYQKQLSGSSCGKDLLLGQIQKTVSTTVLREIEPIRKTMEGIVVRKVREEVAENKFIKDLAKVINPK